MSAPSCWRSLFLKELRVRMRSRAATVAANLYVVALALVLAFVFRLSDGFDDAAGSKVGREMFKFVALIHMAFAGMVCPLLAASLITGEREQKTFDSLCAAPVAAASLLGAKLMSVVVYFLALQCVTLPMMSISFILGGVTPAAVAVATTLTAAFTVFVGAAGLYASCRFRRSIASVPAAGIGVLAGVFLAANEGLGSMAISAVTPAAFTAVAEESSPRLFFGTLLDPWLASLVLMILGAALLFEMARQRMLFERERRPVLARLLFVVLAAVALAFECGGRVRGGFCGNSSGIPAAFQAMLVFLFFAAPWLGARRAALTGSLPRAGPGRPGLVSRLMLDGRFVLALLLLVCAGCLAWTVETDGGCRDAPELSPWVLFLGIVVPCAISWLRFAELLTGHCAPSRRPVFGGVAYAVCGALAIIPLYLNEAGIKAGGLMVLATPLSVASRYEYHMDAESLPVRLAHGHHPVWLSVALFAAVAVVLWLVPLRRRAAAVALSR